MGSGGGCIWLGRFLINGRGRYLDFRRICGEL